MHLLEEISVHVGGVLFVCGIPQHCLKARVGRRRVRLAREELKMAVNLTLKNFRVLETVLKIPSSSLTMRPERWGCSSF